MSALLHSRAMVAPHKPPPKPSPWPVGWLLFGMAVAGIAAFALLA